MGVNVPTRLFSPSRPFIRCVRTSSIVRHLAVAPHSTETKAVEETQDVTALDELLKVVRKKSDPAYNSIIPMGSPMLWSDAILASLTSTSATYDATPPPPLSDPLPPRHGHDSYSELVLPFASNKELFEQYTNASGGIRTGKLLEHLDSLAGSISYKHVLGRGVELLGCTQQRGFYIVTASVDRLDMLGPLHPVRDLRLSGQVIYTGRSSMEVAVKMEAMGSDGAEETIMLGRFSMVCRDSITHRARNVNQLIISTPEEQALFTMGEGLKQRRKSYALRSLSRVPPTTAEAQDLHSFYLNYGQEDGNGRDGSHPQEECVWIGDTHLEKTLLMFPQERNVHQKIFGGYLMRLAYELGFTNSILFTRSPVRFLSLDGISFTKPVPIGSILRLGSHILHTTSSTHFPMLVHVGVQANVVDVKTGFEQTTNDFRFTWCCDEKLPQRKVVPKTYKEAMLWLEGKRALEMGAEIRELRSGEL